MPAAPLAFGGAATGRSDLGQPHNVRPIFNNGEKARDVSPEQLLAIRQELWQVKALLWEKSHLKRVQTCGKKVVGKFASVKSGGVGKKAGFGGIETCGSISSCPSCAKRISSERSDEIARAVTEWTGRGRSVGFLTFTMRHFKGQSLERNWEQGLQAAWSRVVSSRVYKEGFVSKKNPLKNRMSIKSSYGIQGYIRVIEVTYSEESGWHPHFHCLFFFEEKLSDAEVKELGGELYDLWADALEKLGFPKPFRTVKQEDGSLKLLGVDARVVVDGALALGQYFAKSIYPIGTKTQTATRIGTEMSMGSTSKHARFDGLTPFQLLKYFVETGDLPSIFPGHPSALELWHEWEQVSKGKRIFVWSDGLRALLGFSKNERTDDEISADDAGGVELVLIPSRQWAMLIKYRLWLLPLILGWADADPTGKKLKEQLDHYEVEWINPPQVRLQAVA